MRIASPPNLAVSVASPPCAPTPGIKKGTSGNFARRDANSLGNVAPITSPTLPPSDRDTTCSATISYTILPVRASVISCTSIELGFEVLHTTNTPRSLYAKNGEIDSQPWYAYTVQASTSQNSNIAFAYASAVLPMSPRFASANTNACGAASRMWPIVFSSASRPSIPIAS